MFEKQGGILQEDGITTDIDSYGVYVVTVVCIVAHASILRFIRHWDPIYLFWFCFSIFWIPFTLWDEQAISESRV
jgi:hypothetical protein